MLEVTLIYGFVNSIILALIALGFSLTFGISGVSNFAYGSFYVLAGYTVLDSYAQAFNSVSAGGSFLSVLFTVALGSLLYRFVLLRIRGREISEVIATFGVGLAILELFRYLGFTGFRVHAPASVKTSTASRPPACTPGICFCLTSRAADRPPSGRTWNSQNRRGTN